MLLLCLAYTLSLLAKYAALFPALAPEEPSIIKDSAMADFVFGLAECTQVALHVLEQLAAQHKPTPKGLRISQNEIEKASLLSRASHCVFGYDIFDSLGFKCPMPLPCPALNKVCLYLA